MQTLQDAATIVAFGIGAGALFRVLIRRIRSFTDRS